MHLAVVLDLGSRRLLSYAMAPDMAVGARGGRTAGIVFHSDRGSQAGFKWSSQHLDRGDERTRTAREPPGPKTFCGRSERLFPHAFPHNPPASSGAGREGLAARRDAKATRPNSDQTAA